MKTIKVCPVCGAKRFNVTAHVTQRWEVDEYGQYSKTLAECEEVTHDPDDDDIWTCAECGHDAPGSEFNKEVEEKTKKPDFAPFLDDNEKMVDFVMLSKEEFLASYSYLTEEEYDMTAEAVIKAAEKISAEGKITRASKKAEDDSIDITVYASTTMAFTEEECDSDNLTQIRVRKDLLKRWLGETWTPGNNTPSSIDGFLNTYTADNTESLVWWLLDNGYGLEIPGKKLYKYGMRLRPYGIGCQPKEGFLWREDPECGSQYHDVIVYRNPLPDEVIEHYSLSPIDSPREEAIRMMGF